LPTAAGVSLFGERTREGLQPKNAVKAFEKLELDE
jgi:hypothetical protein